MEIKNKKTVLFISCAAIILFLIVFFSNMSEIQEYERASKARHNISNPICINDTNALNGLFENDSRRAHPPIPLSYRMLLSPALLMIAAIFATYYFISRRLEEKLEKNMNIISRLIDKNNSGNPAAKEGAEKTDNSAVLKFFSASERRIIEKLIENNGTVLQAEISRMDGMNKLKTHRTIKDLERKGIITTEGFGKTNRILLVGDVRDILMGK